MGKRRAIVREAVELALPRSVWVTLAQLLYNKPDELKMFL
jgi:hypothetical protein